jgi:hypothetical protein
VGWFFTLVWPLVNVLALLAYQMFAGERRFSRSIVGLAVSLIALATLLNYLYFTTVGAAAAC